MDPERNLPQPVEHCHRLGVEAVVEVRTCDRAPPGSLRNASLQAQQHPPGRGDALVAALETWPQSGVPDNPGAWLMATAKHRAIDALRRGATFERKQQELVRERRFDRERIAERETVGTG